MQIANLAKKLEAVGLTEKQAKVYVAALFLGPAAVQRISEQAEVNRATTYVILAELASMGLVSESTEGKKTVFVAEPPEAIERYLSSIEKEVTHRKEELKKNLSELKQVNRVGVEDAPVVRFFKGPEAAMAVSAYLARKATKKQEVYSMTDIDSILEIFPDILSINPKRRLKKEVSSKVFYSGAINVPNDAKTKRSTIKLSSPVKGDVNIYEDRMTILTYKGKDSTGVIIESPEIVAPLRQLFELAWNKQKSE